MQITQAVSLQPYHTFGVQVFASDFCLIQSVNQLETYRREGLFSKQKFLVLGEGSDVLFVNDFEGLILKNELAGLEIISESDTKIRIRIASGANWHTFVEYCVSNNWGGLENLALIPGTVGAAPIQNIGAYGVEVKDTLDSVDAIDLLTGDTQTFYTEELKLSYRWSIFKEAEYVNRYFITACEFVLNKKPEINMHYKDLVEELADKEKTIQHVFNAVVAIRKRKLPDVEEYGNAGSFFKNPYISWEEFSRLKIKYPELKGFDNGVKVKLAAAQLIDLCGWKGKVINGAGVYKNQALVIVNYGSASGQDIFDLSQKIRESVIKKFGIELTPEVNIYR